ncbi:MAG: hypothetical protein PHR81_00785 [Bacteroidales bacterium]|jgi:hypothetical protein|nr:hypothetical protein [Bacteroidales bacterium]MDD4213324.1 hypothetical protein [Bacteroidales bacterium]
MPEPTNVEPGYKLFYLLHGLPLLYTIIAFLILLSESILINNLFSENNVLLKNSYLTAFLYILFMSSTPAALTLHPVLIINGLIILILHMLFGLKSKNSGIKEIFIAGMLIGISSLFFIKSCGLLLFVWIYLIIFQIYSWREWVVSILGFITVYLYLFTYYFLTEQINDVVLEYKIWFENHNLLLSLPKLSVYQYVTSIALTIFSLLAIFKIIFSAGQKLIYPRKMTYSILWLYILTFISSFFIAETIVFDFSYVLMPLSIITSYKYQNTKKVLFGEILLWGMIISVVLQKIFIV